MEILIISLVIVAITTNFVSLKIGYKQAEIDYVEEWLNGLDVELKNSITGEIYYLRASFLIYGSKMIYICPKEEIKKDSDIREVLFPSYKEYYSPKENIIVTIKRYN